MIYPKITISYNKFLDPIFIGYIQAQPQWKDWIPKDKSTIDSFIEMYNHEWKKYENKILKGICEITNLEFCRNTIDVHIVSGNPRPFSRPIVMKSSYNNVDFINILTHELIHCLFADNEKELNGKHFYEHENKIVEKHAIVHAVLKHIYIDVLNEPERLTADINTCKNSKYGYDTAWDIVEKEGYKELIKRLK